MAEFTTKAISSTIDADDPFGWTARYDLTFQNAVFETDLRVRLTGDDAGSLETIWQDDTNAIWNQRVFFADANRLYEVKLDFSFVSSGEHQVVEVISGFGHTNMVQWYTDSGWPFSFQGRVAAHEVGHMFGAPDEYPGGGTFNNFTTTGTLMSDLTLAGFEYYFWNVELHAEQHSGSTLSTVLAQRGTSSADGLVGTAGMDGFYAFGGNDVVDGLAGNDYIDAGSGHDDLNGGDGNDIMVGGAGDDFFDWWSDVREGADTMMGGEGNDVYVVDGTGTDVVIDTAGRDLIWTPITYSIISDTSIEELALYGSAVADLTGNLANNRLAGNASANVLTGMSGNDNLAGNAGADTLLGGEGNDKLNGGAGSDTANYSDASAGVVVKLSVVKAQNTVGDGTDTLTSVERVFGSEHDDQLHGSTGNNVLNGWDGNDLLRGLDGNDTLIGGGGIDTASYAGATSKVTVRLSLATAQKTGGAGTDTLSEIENLTGSSFDDRLFGSDAANVLAGGSGNDQLRGGLGNDTLTGGGGKDQFFFDSAPGASNIDTITDFRHATDRITLDDDVFTALTVTKARALKAANLSVTGAANDADDFIVYDPATGALYYDADGSGAGAAVQFALLGTSTHPAISAADIFITT